MMISAKHSSNNGKTEEVSQKNLMAWYHFESSYERIETLALKLIPRLRLVPLSLSSSRVTRKKKQREENGRAKSWGRDTCERRAYRLSRAQSLNYVFLSQRKNVIGLC